MEDNELRWDNYCPHCAHFVQGTFTCSKLHFNLGSHPKTFINKCAGKFYKLDKDKKIELLEKKVEKAKKENTIHADENTHIGNYKIYFSLLYGGLFLVILGAIIASGDENVARTFFGLGGLSVIAAQVFFMVLFYQTWRFVINESHRDDLTPSIETPGKALGYCFIPFYNFYWLFIAFGKLPKDINKLAEKRSVESRVSDGLGIVIPVLLLAGFIPFVGYFTGAANLLILYPIFISSSIRLCRELGGEEKLIK